MSRDRDSGCLRLAVAAPRGVEFDEDILGVVEDNVFVRVSDNDGHGGFLLFWDRLRLDAGLEFAVHEIFDKSANLLLGKLVAVKGVFLVLDGLLNGERWERIGGEVQIGGVGTKCFGIDNGHIDLASVLLCDRLQGLSELSSLFRSLGEDVGEGNASLRWIRECAVSKGMIMLTAM
jgi:hypothetical protein